MPRYQAKNLPAPSWSRVSPGVAAEMGCKRCRRWAVGCCKRPLPAQARVSCRHPNSAAGGPEAPLLSTRGRAPPPGALGPACGVAIPPGESLCSRHHVGGGCGCQPRAQCLSPAPGLCLWGEYREPQPGPPWASDSGEWDSPSGTLVHDQPCQDGWASGRDPLRDSGQHLWGQLTLGRGQGLSWGLLL